MTGEVKHHFICLFIIDLWELFIYSVYGSFVRHIPNKWCICIFMCDILYMVPLSDIYLTNGVYVYLCVYVYINR